MSRADVLVDADWVEAHHGEPGVVLVEVDEDTAAYDKGHIRNAVKIDWKKDLQDPVRRDFVDQAGLREAAVRARHRQRRHRRALRRQQQLVRRVRVLVLQALRAPERQAARRRPQEVGAGLPRAGHRGAARPATSTTPRSRTPRSARSATRSSPRSAARTWSTFARPTSSPASCSPPPTCRRSSRSAAATSRRARNVPWSKAANEDGTFKSDDELRTLYGRGGRRRRQGHHRLLPHRRALRAHLVRAARAARPAEREELRRLVDRVRLAGRRPDRVGRRVTDARPPRAE